MTTKSITKVAFCALLSAVTMPATLSHAADVFAQPQSQAADYVPQAVHDWSGGYVGGSIGKGQAETNGVYDTDESVNYTNLADFFDLNGNTFSGHIGFNQQLSNGLVVGIEGDWSRLDWSETRADLNGDSDEATFELNSIMTLRARMGTAINNGSTLIFGTGGAAWLDASYGACDDGDDDYDCEDISTDEFATIDFDEMGWVAGAGIEHMVSSSFSVRAEGLFYRWDEQLDTSDLLEDSDDNDFAQIRNAVQFRVGASYHF